MLVTVTLKTSDAPGTIDWLTGLCLTIGSMSNVSVAGRLVAEGAMRELLTDAQLMEEHGLEVPHSLSHHAEKDKHHP